MATHSRILAWEIPWTEEPRGLWYMESQKSRTQNNKATKQQQRHIEESASPLLRQVSHPATEVARPATARGDPCCGAPA